MNATARILITALMCTAAVACSKKVKEVPPPMDTGSTAPVTDTGPGTDALYNVRAEQSTGVGLANIRDRLAQAYGDNHRFETQSEITGGFRVFIEIPYQIEAEEPK